MRRLPALVVLSATTLVACAAILDLPNPKEDPGLATDGATADQGASVDASTDTSPPDTGGDGSPCSADLQIDGHNCGACGHDCLGGACTQSKCQPVKVVSSSSLAPYAMTLSGSTLYFTNVKGSSLGSMAKALKTATNNDTPPVVLSDWSSKQGTPFQVSASGTDVYFAVHSGSAANYEYDGALMRCPSETCQVALSVKGIDSYAIATDGANVYTGERAYVGTVDKYFIRKRNMDLSNPITVGETGTDANWITLTSGEVIWGDSDGLYHCAKGGCSGAPQKLASPWDKSVEAIAIAGNTLFFTSNPYADVATLQSVSIGGGLPVQLTKDLQVPLGVAADSTYVYVAEIGDTSNPSTGRVFRCPHAGCGTNDTNLEVLFSGENPRTVVSDANALYFGTREGNIYRLAK